MKTTTVTAKGQIVIPAIIRQRYGIKKGIKLFIMEKENQIILQPLTADYFQNTAGVLGSKGKLTKALLKERAREKEREVKR